LSENTNIRYPGELRAVNVDSNEGNAGYSDYSVVESELIYMCDNFNSLQYPSLLEIVELKVDFIKTHPFEGGNGRLSRYLLNWALLKNSYIPVTIPFERRSEYIDSLKKCTGMCSKPFYDFLVDLLTKQYKILNSSISTNPYE